MTKKIHETAEISLIVVRKFSAVVRFQLPTNNNHSEQIIDMEVEKTEKATKEQIERDARGLLRVLLGE